MQLLHVSINCHFSKYSQILYIFAQIFKDFAILTFLCTFSEKIAPMPLLSGISPVSILILRALILHRNQKVFLLSPVYKHLKCI